MLKNFLGLFLATLFICIFILLMQFVWMHVSDLVGKGVGLGVMAEFMVYAVASVLPLALPLAILLASLITFGNLGENFELISMKAAGISLFRIMRPLTIAIAFVSVGAFFFSNNVLPKAQVKLWTLIFSLRQKSPELDIPQGEFYHGIRGYNIYVKHKDTKTGLLENLMIYDFSKGFNDAVVCVADSGRLFFTEDKQYLVLRLFNGESFENLSQDQQQNVATRNIPYRRESFTQKQLLISFNTEFNRYDESVLEDQHVSKNTSQLLASIDSVQEVVHQQSREQSEQTISNRFFGRDRQTHDTLIAFVPDSSREFALYTLMENKSIAENKHVIDMAVEQAHRYNDEVTFNALILDESKKYVRRHEIELYRKFTLAFACLIFFFIGAPLGAIIRKGGLGAPTVISVVMFIIYYIIDNTGYKMAREALWPCWQGMWLSSFVLLPIGIFLTYKAATDSALYNPEAWIKIWNQFILKIKSLWIKLKTH